MDVMPHIINALGSTLGSLPQGLKASTPLLGNIPELDSMAVVNVIAALEEGFGIFFEDDEVTAEMFETLGSLCEAVQKKLNGSG